MYNTNVSNIAFAIMSKLQIWRESHLHMDTEIFFVSMNSASYKGLCHKDIAVLDHFCAKVII